MPGKKPSFWDKFEDFKKSEAVYNSANRPASENQKQDYNKKLRAFLGSAYVYNSCGDSLTLKDQAEMTKALERMPKPDITGTARDNFMFLREPGENGNVYLLTSELDPSGHLTLNLSDHPVTEKEFETICCNGSFIDQEMNKPTAPGWGDWFANLWSRLLGRGPTKTYQDYYAVKEYYQKRVDYVKENVGLKAKETDIYDSLLSQEVPNEENEIAQTSDGPTVKTAKTDPVTRDMNRIGKNITAESLGYEDEEIPDEHLDAFVSFGKKITELAQKDEEARSFLAKFGKDNTRILYGAYRTEYNNDRIMDVTGMISDAVHKQSGEAGQLDLAIVVMGNRKLPERSTPKSEIDAL